MFFNFMEVVMKKSLVLVAMLAVATTLFAETEIVSCESDLGKCTYTLSDEFFSQECTCRDGMGEGEDSTIDGTQTLPTDEECDAELEKVCKNAGIKCENEAGECHLEQNGDYSCRCYGIEGINTGSGIFSETACNDTLVEICGTEAMTARKICTEAGFLDVCVSYIEKINNTCLNPIDGINDILDAPLNSDSISYEIGHCCQYEEYRNEYKNEFDCLEASGTCNTCVDMPFDEGEDGKEDAANTDVAGNGSASAEDTADGDSAPATDSEATAEKEESKSDGCSMLFI